MRMVLKVIVEAAGPEGIWGWAVNEIDYAARLTVEVRDGADVLVAGRADLPRPDLAAAGIGDGRYGFVLGLSSDVYLSSGRDGLDIVGLDESGDETFGIFVNGPGSKLGAIALRPSQPFTIAGSSFLVDNIRDFNAMVTLNGTPPRARFLAVRMYIFGDFLWWDDLETRTSPSARRYFTTIGPESRAALAADALTLVFDMSNEGVDARRDGDLWLVLLHHELASQDISPSRCVLINQNRAFEAAYRQWCREQGIVERLRILTYDYYVARMAYLLDAAAMPPARRERPSAIEWRHFICLNFTARETRTAFVGWLVGSGLADHGFLSFHGFANSKERWDGVVPDWLPERASVEAGLASLREHGRLVLDLAEDGSQATPEFDLGPSECYAQSFFTIVTETDFSTGEIERITEKSIKPLAWGHPILLVGNPRSLTLLRDLGFQTFHPFIDESYDLIDDRAERMRRLQAELRRLCALDYEELVALQDDLAPVIEHNRLHARRGLAARYRSRIEPDLLAQLDDVHSWSGHAAVGPVDVASS